MISALSGVALFAAVVIIPLDTIAQTPVDSASRGAATVSAAADSVRHLPNFDSASFALAGDTVRTQPADTTPRRRAVVYSDAYGTRATIHRRLSYAMLPLFALSYYTGDQLFKSGSSASSAIRNGHRASATAVSVLFAVNTVTGGINLWEGRHDPIQRKRKLLHTALFAAASAGFTYAGAVLANQAETSLAKRQDHKNLNLISMGLSAGSVLVMMVGND